MEGGNIFIRLNDLNLNLYIFKFISSFFFFLNFDCSVNLNKTENITFILSERRESVRLTGMLKIRLNGRKCNPRR